MFGFKLIRRSKQDEKDALSYKKITIDIYETVNNIYDKLKSNITIGDMEGVHTIGEHIKNLDSLIALYNMNKFSLPSTFLTMTEFMKSLIKMYQNYVSVHSSMKQLTYDVLRYQTDMTLHPEKFDREYDNELKHKVDVMYKDAENSLCILVPEIITIVIALRTAIGPEKYKVIHDFDIIDDYYKRQKMKTDGANYRISFKMVESEPKKSKVSTKEEK